VIDKEARPNSISQQAEFSSHVLHYSPTSSRAILSSRVKEVINKNVLLALTE
jgi:hypothetical protein